LLSDHFLGHQIVARKVQAFIGGKVWIANMHHSGCPVSVHTNMSVTINEQCRKKDRFWTVHELAKHTGISPSIVHWILWQDLNSAGLLQSGYYLISTRCNSECAMEYVSINPARFTHKGDMLKCITTEIKWQSSEWCHPIHQKNSRFHKIPHTQSWWSYWCIMFKVFLCFVSFHRVKLWMHNIINHFCGTTCHVVSK
jgi:hypothetical protein